MVNFVVMFRWRFAVTLSSSYNVKKALTQHRVVSPCRPSQRCSSLVIARLEEILSLPPLLDVSVVCCAPLTEFCDAALVTTTADPDDVTADDCRFDWSPFETVGDLFAPGCRDNPVRMSRKKNTLGARTPNIFEYQTSFCSDLEWFSFGMV